jgi:uncharacterized protein (TIGR02266 family)
MDQDQQGMIQQRQFERKPIKVEVGLHTETNFFKGFTEDISEGGIFICTYDIKRRGEIVEIEFNLPDENEVIRVKGEVRWIRQLNSLDPDTVPGMGLLFIDLSPDHKKMIEKFIKRREPLFYE